VRVIGLAEGHIPAVAREDPVLPDVLREGLSAAGRAAPVTAADRALGDLHALDSAVRDARDHVALSFARMDVDRSQREPSSVLLEAAAALGRPHRITGERTPTIPDAATLQRDAFVPAREAAAAFVSEHPIGLAARLDGVAAGRAAPASWRLRDVSGGGAAADGLLGAAAAELDVPGLTSSRPISASALEKLLACPHRFLLAEVLGLEKPAAPPERREIGQPHYGSLVHEIAARFLDEHGAAFAAGEGTIGPWLVRLDAIAKKTFAAFLETYPLVGDAVRAQQWERLLRDLHDLMESDWRTAGLMRRFVAAERGFGVPEAVALDLSDRTLYVRGRIDRIDVEGRRALVRDLKSGRAHPRVGDDVTPQPVRDLQIALYGLVAQKMAETWRIPARIAAAYSYVGRDGPIERSFRDDFHEVLEPEARRWLHVAAGLLEQRAFPRTPDEDDCTYCEFRPVCGPGAQTRARAAIDGARAELARGTPSAIAAAVADFAALKGYPDDRDRGDGAGHGLAGPGAAAEGRGPVGRDD
jgi:RecB family exonuclease